MHVMGAAYLGITGKDSKQEQETYENASPEMALGAPSKALSPAQIIMQQIKRDSEDVIRPD